MQQDYNNYYSGDSGNTMRYIPVNSPDMLVIKEAGRPAVNYELSRFGKNIILIGQTRNSQNDIKLCSDIVSANHGLLKYEAAVNKWFYQECVRNTNGTYLNENKLEKYVTYSNSPYADSVELMDGDVLRIDDSRFSDHAGVLIFFSRSITPSDQWCSISLNNGKESFSIGRDTQNDLIFDELNISRKHAQIVNTPSGYEIRDLGSAYGTIVHDAEIKGKGCVPLRNRDIIRIGSKTLILWDGELIYHKSIQPISYSNSEARPGQAQNYIYSESANSFGASASSITVKNLSRTVMAKEDGLLSFLKPRKEKKILRDVSFVIYPGELVAVLGGSGAGKTTLINCLNGITKDYDGEIYYGKDNLKTRYNSLKSTIGIAPQSDTLYDNLIVKRFLHYVGLLRTKGSDVTNDEVKLRVNRALKMVSLDKAPIIKKSDGTVKEEKKPEENMIRKLSGGQKKRVSIAMELIADTRTLFLDEPTSGLDPETERDLMNQLKLLSGNNGPKAVKDDNGNIIKGQGKTVIVITHTLQSINYFDKVIFMAPGGRLSGWGTVDQLKEKYGVDDLIDAYNVILEKGV